MADARDGGQGGAASKANGSGQSGGQSQNDSDSGSGTGIGAGAGAGSNARTGGANGGASQPLQDRSGTTGVSAQEPVYVPGATTSSPPASSGPASQVPGRDNGQGQSTSRPARGDGLATEPLVPYQEVYAGYRQQATTALEQETVPPDLRDYVRDHFSLLDQPTP